MMGATHAVIGVTVGVIYGIQLGGDIQQVAFIGGIAAIAALLPDIDHPRGTLRQHFGLLGDASLFWLRHRGFTHTVIAWCAVSAVALYFLPVEHAFAVMMGYGSHLLADSITHSGTPLLWPLVQHNYRLPFLHISTGGFWEFVINLICVGAVSYVAFGLGK